MKLPSAKQLEQELDQLAQQMADPAVARQPARMRELANEHRQKKELFLLVEKREVVLKELDELAELVKSEQAELQDLAWQDKERLELEMARLNEQIEITLTPRDPRDARDVMLEIRAGAGGEEAALFAAELFRAYSRYAEIRGWQVHTISSTASEQGGYKEIVAEVNAAPLRQGFAGQTSGPFEVLKFERGVQRVQRVPETEKMGRIHTSTVTVAVLPQAKEVDIEVRPEDLRIDTYRASGAGGQHVNKTSSAVRITHLPTNTVVAVQDERSQHKNRSKAMSVLRTRLLDAQERARHSEEASERKAQVGTGDRSEKIRTYNYPQDRITDHRIKKSWSNISKVMEGNFDNIFNDLKENKKE
ncbi:MAG: peptide chain release factor 1 [bacterium]